MSKPDALKARPQTTTVEELPSHPSSTISVDNPPPFPPPLPPLPPPSTIEELPAAETPVYELPDNWLMEPHTATIDCLWSAFVMLTQEHDLLRTQAAKVCIHLCPPDEAMLDLLLRGFDNPAEFLLSFIKTTILKHNAEKRYPHADVMAHSMFEGFNDDQTMLAMATLARQMLAETAPERQHSAFGLAREECRQSLLAWIHQTPINLQDDAALKSQVYSWLFPAPPEPQRITRTMTGLAGSTDEISFGGGGRGGLAGEITPEIIDETEYIPVPLSAQLPGDAFSESDVLDLDTGGSPFTGASPDDRSSGYVPGAFDQSAPTAEFDAVDLDLRLEADEGESKPPVKVALGRKAEKKKKRTLSKGKARHKTKSSQEVSSRRSESKRDESDIETPDLNRAQRSRSQAAPDKQQAQQPTGGLQRPEEPKERAPGAASGGEAPSLPEEDAPAPPMPEPVVSKPGAAPPPAAARPSAPKPARRGAPAPSAPTPVPPPPSAPSSTPMPVDLSFAAEEQMAVSPIEAEDKKSIDEGWLEAEKELLADDVDIDEDAYGDFEEFDEEEFDDDLDDALELEEGEVEQAAPELSLGESAAPPSSELEPEPSKDEELDGAVEETKEPTGFDWGGAQRELDEQSKADRADTSIEQAFQPSVPGGQLPPASAPQQAPVPPASKSSASFLKWIFLAPLYIVASPFIGLYWLGKKTWQGCQWLLGKGRTKLEERAAEKGVKVFELMLSDDAAKPGPIERSIAQSKYAMRKLQIAFGLKVVAWLSAIDAVLEMITEYAHKVLKAWQSLKAKGKKFLRQRNRTLHQSQAEDLMLARLQLARLLGLPGFIPEKNIPSLTNHELQLKLLEPTFPLELVLTLRGLLDELKRDVATLPKVKFDIVNTVQESAKASFRSAILPLIPNPLAFLASWKDLWIMSRHMHFRRDEVEELYISFLDHYQTTIAMSLEEATAAEAEAGLELPPEVVSEEHLALFDFERALLQSTGRERDALLNEPAMDVKEAAEATKQSLQRLIQALCFPHRIVSLKHRSKVEILREFAQAERLNHVHPRIAIALDEWMLETLTPHKEMLQDKALYGIHDDTIPDVRITEAALQLNEAKWLRKRKQILRKIEDHIGPWS